MNIKSLLVFAMVLGSQQGEACFNIPESLLPNYKLQEYKKKCIEEILKNGIVKDTFVQKFIQDSDQTNIIIKFDGKVVLESKGFIISHNGRFFRYSFGTVRRYCENLSNKNASRMEGDGSYIDSSEYAFDVEPLFAISKEEIVTNFKNMIQQKWLESPTISIGAVLAARTLEQGCSGYIRFTNQEN